MVFVPTHIVLRIAHTKWTDVCCFILIVKSKILSAENSAPFVERF